MPSVAEFIWIIPWFSWIVLRVAHHCRRRRAVANDYCDLEASTAFVHDGEVGPSFTVRVNHVETAPLLTLCRKGTFGSKSHRLLDEMSLTMHGGELCGILGPSGAGKTTFLRTLARRLDPSLNADVTAEWNGVRIDGAWLRRHATYVPSELALPMVPLYHLLFPW